MTTRRSYERKYRLRSTYDASRPKSAHEVEMDSRRNPEDEARPVHEHTANPELLDAVRRLRRRERKWE